jgi:hypothetical protein
MSNLLGYVEAQESPSPSSLRAAGTKLSDWKELAKITGEVESLGFQKREKELENIWGALGWSRTPTGESKRKEHTRWLLCILMQLSVVRVKGSKSFLADREDMELAYRHYLEFCFPSHEEDVAGLLKELARPDDEQSALAYSMFEENQGNEDIGVAEFKSKSTLEMLQLLSLNIQTGQFPFGRPASTVTTDDGTLVEDSPPAKPHWHQLVGTARMLQGFFTKELGQKPEPTLLCDDVGVGKTMQIIGTISMLAHIIELQRQGKTLPPLLERKW